jgi:radical SAM superfamily enzyme YgiQ (UPF0313 family)
MNRKKKEKIVLVHSPPHGEVPFRNMGLAYIQAVLEKQGFETELLDISLEEDRAHTDFYSDYILFLSQKVGDVGDYTQLRILLETAYPELFDSILPVSRTIIKAIDRHFERVIAAGDIFLFTLNVLTQYFASGMAIRLRKQGKKTIAGGPNLGFVPLRNLLLLGGFFDCVVQGEGEPVIKNIIENIENGKLRKIPSVSFLEGKKAVHNESGSAPDIDSLPIPCFRDTLINDFIPVLSSRGCPRKCSFCSEPFNWASYRFRKPQSVVDEMMKGYEKYGLKNFHFHDDLINGNLKWLDEFVKILIERKNNFQWESFCSPEGLNPERLDLMKESGCVLLKLGIQSFSQNVLRLMRRKKQVEFLKNAIIHSSKIGISMHYDMLICFPGETEDDHRRNVGFIEEVYSECRDVYFSPNPFYLSVGSETFLNPEKYGIRIKLFNPEELPHMLSETVRASGNFPDGFEYGIPGETVIKRMEDMGNLLKKHNKDYLYLGKRKNYSN